MNRIKIAFDLDGCLVDFVYVFKKILKDRYFAEIDQDSLVQYDLSKAKYRSIDTKRRVRISKDNITAFVNAAIEAPYEFPIYDDAWELLHRLYTLTKEPVTILTARPIKYADMTHLLVKRFVDVPYSLVFKADKYHKADYLTGFQCYVEDRRKTALELVDRGFNVFLIDKPYNQIQEVPRRGLFRIPGISALIDNVDTFVDAISIKKAA